MKKDPKSQPEPPQPTAAEKKIYQYQDRLPFWPDDYYEQANPIVRSSVFSSSSKRRFYEHYTSIRVLGDGDIQIFGPQLTVFDDSVIMQLNYSYRGKRLIEPLAINRRELLSNLNLGDGGKNYAKLETSLDRLNKSKMKISSRSILKKLMELMTNAEINQSMDEHTRDYLHKSYGPYIDAISSAIEKNEPFYLTMGFVNNYGVNKASGELIVTIDPLMILLLDGINTTRIKRQDRDALASPSSVKLLQYFMSHSGFVHDHKLETYHELLGSETANMRKFKADFVKWMNEIEEIGRIEPGWKVGPMVQGVKPIAYRSDEL